LEKRIQPGDIIVHSNKLTYLPALVFNPNLPQLFIMDPPGSKSDSLAPSTRQVLNLNSSANIKSATENAQRVWFIIFQKSIDEYLSIGMDTHPDIQYLTGHFSQVSVEKWDDILLYCFEKATW
jgi:hypothetical protein